MYLYFGILILLANKFLRKGKDCKKVRKTIQRNMHILGLVSLMSAKVSVTFVFIADEANAACTDFAFALRP